MRKSGRRRSRYFTAHDLDTLVRGCDGRPPPRVELARAQELTNELFRTNRTASHFLTIVRFLSEYGLEGVHVSLEMSTFLSFVDIGDISEPEIVKGKPRPTEAQLQFQHFADPLMRGLDAEAGCSLLRLLLDLRAEGSGYVSLSVTPIIVHWCRRIRSLRRTDATGEGA